MLLEPVRRHESSCVLIWRMGPDTPQLRVTQTQPSRPGYYFVNVNNRSTSVSLHVIASLLGQELLGSSLRCPRCAPSGFENLTHHSPAARGNDADSGCSTPHVGAPVHRSQTSACPQPSTSGRSHSRSFYPKQPRGGGLAWRMRVLVRASAHAPERAHFPLRELRVVVRPGRGEAEAAKIARDPRELSFLAPWRRVVLPISMPAVARALLLRGPSRPVSPRALVGSWLPSSPAAAAASAPDPRPNPGVTSPRHRRAGGYGCLDW